MQTTHNAMKPKIAPATLELTSRMSILSGHMGCLKDPFIPYRFKQMVPRMVAASMQSVPHHVPPHAAAHAAHFVSAVASCAPPMETLCLLAAFEDPMPEMMCKWNDLLQSQLRQPGTTAHRDGFDFIRSPPAGLASLEPAVYVTFYHGTDGWSTDALYSSPHARVGYLHDHVGYLHVKTKLDTRQGDAAEESKDVTNLVSGDHWRFRPLMASASHWSSDSVTIFENETLGVKVHYPESFTQNSDKPNWIDASYYYGKDADGCSLFNAVRYYDDFNIGVWGNEEDYLSEGDPKTLVYYRHYKLYQQRQWFEATMRRLERRFFFTLKERMEKRFGYHLHGGPVHDAAVDELEAMNGHAVKVARTQL